MLCKRVSIPVLAVTSCWLLTGCFGGQAGDEGVGPDKHDAGRGGAGGTADDDVAAGVGGVAAGVGGGGESGTQIPMAGSAESPTTPTGSESDGSSCRFEIWHSPETELETYECFVPGELQNQSGDELPSENNSKVKEWQCDCNGKNLTVEASGCADALQNGCGVAQDSETTFCRNDGDVFGVCWTKEDTGWQCGCGDPVDTVTLVDRDDQECIDALFHVCAQPCDGLLGQCDPLRETDEVGYQCDCTYYGDISRKNWARDCQSALRDACHPNYSNYDVSCNGYVGYCDQSESGYACHCLDGVEQSIEPIEMSAVGCYLALEQVCGENQPPEDRICRVESSSGQGYCVQIGEELYECDCTVRTTSSTTEFIPPPTPTSDGGANHNPASPSQPMNSLDAGMPPPLDAGSVESPSGGGSIITTTVDHPPPTSQQSDLQIAASCEEALIFACPDLIQATPEQKNKACEIIGECYSIFNQNPCIDRMRDDCALCLLEAVERGARCGDEEFTNCAYLCVNLADPPSDSVECKSIIDQFNRTEPVNQCLCDHCLSSFAVCMVDVGCIEIADCAYEHDCVESNCFTVDTCQQVIEKWINGDSITIVQDLGDCALEQGCL